MDLKISNFKLKLRISTLEALSLLGILLTGAVLRLYRIGEYMTFLGDEGRDAIIVRRFLENFDLFLIGPGTSVGDMYLGPLYYYFISLGLWVSNFSPVGPSVQIALFGVLTVGLVWFIGRKLFGRVAGNLAAFLYAISPTVIVFSRSSWNPNIMPFMSLVMVYSLWKTWKYSPRWLIVTGIFFAFVLQSHYLGLIMAPFIGVYWLVGLFKYSRKKALRGYVKYSLFGIIIFLILMSPLLIFDIRHNWINLNGLISLIAGNEGGTSSFRLNPIPHLLPTINIVGTRLIAGRDVLLGGYMGALLLGSTFLIFSKKYVDIKYKDAFLFLYLWLGMGVLGLSLYSFEIYDHYMGFLFAAPFLILGGLAQMLINKAKIRGTWIVLTLLIFLVFAAINNSPFKYQPNNQLRNTEQVASKVVEVSGSNPFNFALISENNYEDAYMFFFEKWGASFVKIDPQNWENTIVDQLLVVCELEDKNKCDPTHSAKAEVANFGWSKIDQQWDVEGVRVYKLSHVEPQ